MNKIINVFKTIFILIIVGGTMIATLFTGYAFTLFITVVSLFVIIYFILFIKDKINQIFSNEKQEKEIDYYAEFEKYCRNF